MSPAAPTLTEILARVALSCQRRDRRAAHSTTPYPFERAGAAAGALSPVKQG